MTDKLNENTGYINYQLAKNPNQTNYQSMTYSSQQQARKSKKSLRSETGEHHGPNTPLSVYNPFLIASSQPLSLTSKFDPTSILANLPATAPALLTSKQQQQHQQHESLNTNISNKTANTSSQQTPGAESPIVTSLPPIVSGKRIKLPLGPHRYL